jgi:hypothetical protein
MKNMRIGHQLFEFLQDWTDTASYCVQEIPYCSDIEGKRLCIKEMYINFDENQVYLVVEDENQNQFHKSVNEFIKLMGGPRPESYAPLYTVRDEVRLLKRNIVKRYKQALRESDTERQELINSISNKLKKYEKY